MRKRIQKYGFIVLVALIFLVGLSVLLYPTVSSAINARNQSRVIVEYNAHLAELPNEDIMNMIEAAHEWNMWLPTRANRYVLSSEEWAMYRELLDFTGHGIIGYVEIASISVNLPIYHGTDESILQIGVGHIEWSSLPVGGVGTHAVLTAHTGLPTAELFTRLDRLTYGETFTVRALGEELVYEVDQILIVEPTDTSALGIAAYMDFVTLITCTPYGVNSHRLLVRGVRVPNTEAEQIPVVVACCCKCWPLILVLIILNLILLTMNVFLLIWYRSKRH